MIDHLRSSPLRVGNFFNLENERFPIYPVNAQLGSIQMLFDIVEFEQWLLAKPSTEGVGLPTTTTHNPISRFFRETRGLLVATDGQQAHAVSVSTPIFERKWTQFTLPPWCHHFLQQVHSEPAAVNLPVWKVWLMLNQTERFFNETLRPKEGRVPRVAAE